MTLISDTTYSILIDLLTQLRLPEGSIALALLYTHKFNKWQGTKTESSLNDELLSLATISLAAKSSEKPRRLREILVPAYNHLNPDKPKLTFPSELYDELRSSLVNAELILLRILKFELRIPTPFEYLDDLLRDYVYFSRTDKTHFEDYVNATDTLLGVVTRATILRALRDPQIAMSYTAKTLATTCMVHSSRSLSMKPLGDASEDIFQDWIKNVAREDLLDITDCFHDLDRLNGQSEKA